MKSTAYNLFIAAVLSTGLAQGAVAVTNGNFESGYDGSNNDPTPEGWFTETTSGFWQAVWHSNNASPNGSVVAVLSGENSTGPEYIYQNIGLLIGGDPLSYTVAADYGNFTDGGVPKTGISLTISIFQAAPATFAGGDNINIFGSAATLIDTLTFTPSPIAVGDEITLTGTFDLSSANNTDALFLAFEHDSGGNYMSLDNVTLVSIPEPAALSFAALSGFALLRRRR